MMRLLTKSIKKVYFNRDVSSSLGVPCACVPCFVPAMYCFVVLVANVAGFRFLLNYSGKESW